MDQRSSSPGEALGSGLAFARAAWRDLWGVQLLFAVGVALVYAAIRVDAPGPRAADLASFGAAVAGVALFPLWAALYRRALGGRLLRELGPLGLQIGLAELRLVALAVAAVAAIGLALLLILGVTAVLVAAFGGLGYVRFGPFAPVRVPLLAAGVAALGLVAVLTWGAARLAFAAPASVGKRRLVVGEAWVASNGSAAAVLAALATAAAPGAALVAALQFVGPQARLAPTDALAAGAAVGLVAAFLQAPLAAGAVSALYRAERARRALPAMDSEPISAIQSAGWSADAPTAV